MWGRSLGPGRFLVPPHTHIQHTTESTPRNVRTMRHNTTKRPTASHLPNQAKISSLSLSIHNFGRLINTHTGASKRPHAPTPNAALIPETSTANDSPSRRQTTPKTTHKSSAQATDKADHKSASPRRSTASCSKPEEDFHAQLIHQRP